MIVRATCPWPEHAVVRLMAWRPNPGIHASHAADEDPGASASRGMRGGGAFQPII